MYTIATLHQLRQRLGLGADDTADDARLLAALQAATAQMEAAAGRRFLPRRASIAHTIHPRNPAELLLDDDLLALENVTHGDGQSIDPAQIIAIPDDGLDGVIGLLRLIQGAAFLWAESPIQAVNITGIWGWHDRWSQAWRDTGDTVQANPLSAGATSISVTDVDGSDTHGDAPRFQVGQLLRIGAEYLAVTGVDSTADTLVVLRGVNGTEAAAHDAGTPVHRYQPPLDVEILCLRWALWLYKEPDNRAFSTTPTQLSGALGGLRRVGVRS